MKLQTLCEKIHLQESFRAGVLDFSRCLQDYNVEKAISALTHSNTAPDACETLIRELGDDPQGIKILTCYLHAAILTHENYQRLGIDDAIFFETMRCFPRYIEETNERSGRYAFDRARFCHRHISMKILRIGALEYEMKEREGVLVNAVHIPTDASFTREALDASFHSARRLIRKFFPEFANAPITCESWLLGASLKDILNEDSRILAFQKRFDIRPSSVPGTDYRKFIFHRDDCSDYASLPENTSLQKKIKQRLLAGLSIDCGFGILQENE